MLLFRGVTSLLETGTQVRRLLISAFGINSGGGLVLFKALVDGARDRIRSIELDARLSATDFHLPKAVGATSVPRSFVARIRSSIRLARQGTSDDVLLCFNSLPPLVRSQAKVVTYVHAPHFVNAHRGIRYSHVTRIRIWLERLWFNFALRHTDEAWVQTPTMASALQRLFPHVTVRIMPLVDETLGAQLARMEVPTQPAEAWRDVSFFYPADTVGHKNHVNLLRAWRSLHAAGHRPELWLTLDRAELSAMLARAGLSSDEAPDVHALGRLSREDVLSRLAMSSGLIFPSTAETFGLPMLEATALGKPIIASERDFVRDVCRPTQTFDPDSPASIARAVTRFIEGDASPLGPFLSADQFVGKLLS